MAKKTSSTGLSFRKDGVNRTPVKKEHIGRNEKCPCGSGKKYKKCCGLKSGGLWSDIKAFFTGYKGGE